MGSRATARPSDLEVLAQALQVVRSGPPDAQVSARLVVKSVGNMPTASWEQRAAAWRAVKAKRRAGWMLGQQLLRRAGPATAPRLPVAALVPGLQWVVVLTRQAPRRLDAPDNISSAFKAIRDGVAQAFGVNDGALEVAWLYDQRKGPEQVDVALWRAP